jgi:hypothetical protein
MRVGGAVAPYAMKLFGMGDYTVAGKVPERNSLFTNGNYSFNKGAFVVSNREFIADVVSGTAGNFAYNTYDINPGQSLSFPWLSNIA